MKGPTLREIQQARERLGSWIRRTPVWEWQGLEKEHRVGNTSVFLKLELLQYAGTFKPRGALLNMFEMDAAALARGITTVSAGNHAMAAAYAARMLESSAKVVMPKSANPARVQGCRELGAEVLLVEDVQRAFDEVHRIEREEGRTFVHPFEGPGVALGTATLGLELCEQVPDLEAVIVPIGGGGLMSGTSTAVKLMQPRCRVYGVEPEGADTMHRSFASGKPESIPEIKTIADSLGAPHAAPHTFELCRAHVDELVKVTDDDLRRTMLLLFRDLKLAVEPAAAAALAALLGPLRAALDGKRVALIVCGTNIDFATFRQHLEDAGTVR